MSNRSPKLPLTPQERARLRTFKITTKEICKTDVDRLASLLDVPKERATFLRALAQFQSIPSIGPRMAEAMIMLGYVSLEEVRDEDGAELVDRYEQCLGYWVDPCVEDSFRCIVYHANHEQSEKSWFDFTSERKRYRAQHGYPATRPVIAWHEKEKPVQIGQQRS